MFPDDRIAGVPADATPVRWVCGECGNDNQRRVHLEDGVTLMDDRYGVGHCDDCTPARRTVRGIKRQTVALVRADVFDRARFQRQRVEAEEAELLRRYRAGHLLTKEDIERVRQIVDRQGG